MTLIVLLELMTLFNVWGRRLEIDSVLIGLEVLIPLEDCVIRYPISNHQSHSLSASCFVDNLATLVFNDIEFWQHIWVHL